MTLRIGFVGICQAAGMAAAARAMLPWAAIDSHHIGAPLAAAAIRQRIAGFDLIVTQFTDAASGLTVAALAGHVGQALHMPVAAFTGFHPDMIYLTRRRGPVPGPWDAYHSRLALAGFLAGLDAARTVRLFNAHVFAELGYFAAWPIAERAMTASFATAGYDLAPWLGAWRGAGLIFMHTINHPTQLLMTQMAAMALARAGLVDVGAALPIDLPDAMAGGFVAPVLPPIARRLGVAGSEVYLRSPGQSPGGVRAVALAGYIEESHRIYRQTPPRRLASPDAIDAAATLARLLA